MSATLDYLLQPLSQFRREGVEEIILNGPDSAFIWAGGRFEQVPVSLTAEEIEDIAIVAGFQRGQEVGRENPLLDTDLPSYGRLSVVLPPHVAPGQTALTIRIGSSFKPTLDLLSAWGLFKKTHPQGAGISQEDEQLIELYRRQNWDAFFRDAVLAKKTIVLCGETASGKSTVALALADSIPRDERVIIIEDTPEVGPRISHANKVAMYFDGGAKDSVTGADLVRAALRMRIGRLIYGEIRDGAAAIAFLQALLSGHPGGITTIHAPSASMVFKRLGTVIKQTPWGAAIDSADLDELLKSLIDIVVHCYRRGNEFSLGEVWFGAAERAGVT